MRFGIELVKEAEEEVAKARKHLRSATILLALAKHREGAGAKLMQKQLAPLAVGIEDLVDKWEWRRGYEDERERSGR